MTAISIARGWRELVANNGDKLEAGLAENDSQHKRKHSKQPRHAAGGRAVQRDRGNKDNA